MLTTIQKTGQPGPIEEVKDTVKAKANDMAEAIYDKAEDMTYTTKDLKKQAYKAGVQLREWVDNVQHQAEETRDIVKKTIRERPFLSTAAVFAAGLITARLLSRR